MSPKHWLMKAEPDSRIVKGKDVKFSVDDFESIKTTSWEGVRNAEARNIMKSMSVGDKVLFYHSNCKTPGIAAIAEVSKEAYPDYTAWDPDHPYFDEKTDKSKPKWYMVDVTFESRLAHFIPLSLLKSVAGSSKNDPDEGLSYIGNQGVKAIKTMPLVTRGRLSVQHVDAETYDLLVQLGERGGWEDVSSAKKKGKKRATAEDEGHGAIEETRTSQPGTALIPEQKRAAKKRKVVDNSGTKDETGVDEKPKLRRSIRAKRR
ncbi:hypothetical protein EUX98_g2283 [Antrodiella citrinella]|uniref:EVE domain-containing protein n=1 Tax=Antrodiella citrinella TaxID=2447956 RepID=A0A4S4N7Q2_9APHY|nr:hypothetical protein EUX98_g2283 [Antrodiella citrinella]